jgi:chemotaxis protein CheD
MFADTGLAALLRTAAQMKAENDRLQICLAGGARVMDSDGFFDIGTRNYASVACLLRARGLRIQAEQVGGMVSRTVTLNVRTGEVRLKVSGQAGEFVLCKGG